MATTTSRSQIPLHFEWFGRDGKLTQPAAFWLQSLFASLPPSGSGYVIDGSQGTYGPMTLFQGIDAAKGGTPSPGYIYFALDTGKIYVSNGGVWVEQLPAFTGDVTKPAGSNVVTLNSVNLTPGTWGDGTNIPRITTDAKGRILSVTLEPVGGSSATPGGVSTSIQYNQGGVFTGNPVFTYNPITNTLTFGNAQVNGTMAFANPNATLNNLLPTQTGLAGDVLSTDGTNTYWASSGDSEIIFNYGDATPKPLFIVPADKIIESVSIYIMTAFDDPTATLSIGDMAVVDSQMATTDNLPSVLGTYSVEPADKYGVATQLYLTITAGASTQGSGLVKITYQR